jgi:hypothetical protein
MLSRDSHVLMAAPTAAAIVTGTYAACYEKVSVAEQAGHLIELKIVGAPLR